MGARDQAGVIPFRRKRDAVEICLIRNKGQRKWKIPKGFVDPGETRQQAALKEAREEAGLTGRLVGDPIGSLQVHKWGSELTVSVYLMEVPKRKTSGRSPGSASVAGRRWTRRSDAAEASCVPAARRRRHKAGAEKEAEVEQESEECRQMSADLQAYRSYQWGGLVK